MYIDSIELKDFRNYEELKLKLNRGTNIFYGNNAQGKTNLLEAVYMGGTSKSHRSSGDRETIRFGKDEAHIKINFTRHDVPQRIDMHIKKNKSKGIALNGIPIKRASELFGIINIIFFSPEDLAIIKNGPSERRRFIDMELCQLNKIYVHDLISYNSILRQRNKLLKEYYDPKDSLMLDIYDEQLCDFGKRIIASRDKFIKRLNSIIREKHHMLTGGREELSIFYEKNTDEEAFKSELKRSRASDIRQHTSLTGPHRDDIRFIINDIDIRHFGSQGQQRTAALSLKLSEIELVEELTNDTPVLLLDDVLSELDSERQKFLLNAIKNVQTLISSTGTDEFINNNFHMDEIFYANSGKVIRGETNVY